jgi:hypothetical protein
MTEPLSISYACAGTHISKENMAQRRADFIAIS